MAGALWLLTLSAGPVRADWLVVQRGPGAEGCPDAQALQQRVKAIGARTSRTSPPSEANTPANVAEAADAYAVVFERESTRLLARLRPRANSTNVRTLVAVGTSCEPLAEATALALALLLDSVPLPANHLDTDAAMDSPSTAQAPSPLRAERARQTAPALHVSLALGGGLLLGVTQRAAPALQGDVSLWQKRLRFGLGVDAVPVQRRRFGPGTLHTWQLASAAKACLALYASRALRFDACSGAYLGMIAVRSSGYTRNAERIQPWFALPAELATHVFSGPVALAFGASALIPIERPEFSIAALGRAYASWPVSVLLSLKLTFVWPRPAAAQKK